MRKPPSWQALSVIEPMAYELLEMQVSPVQVKLARFL